MEDLRLVIETAKRSLTEEKIDRQLAGHSSSTPFMNIKDCYCLVLQRELANELHVKINKIPHNRKTPKSVVLSRVNTVLTRGQHTISCHHPYKVR